jgi:hypothetical protein
MQRSILRLAVVILALVGGAGVSTAAAQTLVDRGYRAVEQTSEDMGPLSRSFRRVEPGLHQSGGQASTVYRRAGAPNKLYYIAPGITAEYDRSSYAWFEIQKDDWRLFQLIPPNTVFHLGPPPADAEAPLPAPNAIRDASVVDARVQGAVSEPAPAPAPNRTAIAAADRWASFDRFRQAQLKVVASALTLPETGEAPATDDAKVQ